MRYDLPILGRIESFPSYSNPSITSSRSNISSLFDKISRALSHDTGSIVSAALSLNNPGKAVRDSEVRLSRVELIFTEEEIAILKFTWSLEAMGTEHEQEIVDPRYSLFGTSYFWNQVYGIVLESHPNAGNMVPTVDHQTRAFAGMMYLCMRNLEDLTKLDEYLASLGRRHSRMFGAQPPHFEAVGVAVIETFQQYYGDVFTKEIAAIWIKLYCFLANSMVQASLYDPIIIENKLVFPTLVKAAEESDTPSGKLPEEARGADSVADEDAETMFLDFPVGQKGMDILRKRRRKRLGDLASKVFGEGYSTHSQPLKSLLSPT
ncbi:hypothetical protein BABINDRAFT_159070 [Babjeviella inositovora NRRL Y-12698]|uniref:Globin domain-containing protein n=1 Tax=Babjeviella inositovora NRRL Y-12698 TaxID=984486 RepID=A0A1E3QXU9_9ASCO|nr:uncharacterized protein BABINDRAFT_159070 [Babjeviella inositovora NRRL Y-12698]ODQ82493.1 hypothetical protein BABINDRAFT_159070 [Babjeviella inositovora NRRL Y-12698]